MNEGSPLPAGELAPSRAGDDLLIVAIGVLALAVAMGIGRFAFTPLLPLMLRDGSITPGAGAEWAAANYLGYLVGALSAAHLFAGEPRRGLLAALAGIVVTTLAGAVLDGWLGAGLRFAAGVFSAWTLVCASSWCLAELAQRSAAGRGAWIFTGVGVGIAVAGLLAWWGGRQSAAALWLEMGLLAAIGSAAVWGWLRRFGRGTLRHPPAKPKSLPAPLAPPTAAPGQAALVWCYGAMGFGYITPATFLPAMAREQVADPLVFGLTWPLFGVAAALSVAAAARWLAAWPRRRVWAAAQATMALGTAVPLLQFPNPSIGALAASALFVGGTFMVATMAGLQLARERSPANATALLARMTAAFAVGQISGPLLVRLLAPLGLDHRSAVAVALVLATVALLGTALWLWRGEPASTPLLRRTKP